MSRARHATRGMHAAIALSVVVAAALSVAAMPRDRTGIDRLRITVGDMRSQTAAAALLAADAPQLPAIAVRVQATSLAQALSDTRDALQDLSLPPETADGIAALRHEAHDAAAEAIGAAHRLAVAPADSTDALHLAAMRTRLLDIERRIAASAK
jgi:hypothetical protein